MRINGSAFTNKGNIASSGIIQQLFESALQIAVTKNFRKRPVMTVVAVGGYGGELLIADGNIQNAMDAQVALSDV